MDESHRWTASRKASRHTDTHSPTASSAKRTSFGIVVTGNGQRQRQRQRQRQQRQRQLSNFHFLLNEYAKLCEFVKVDSQTLKPRWLSSLSSSSSAHCACVIRRRLMTMRYHSHHSLLWLRFRRSDCRRRQLRLCRRRCRLWMWILFSRYLFPRAKNILVRMQNVSYEQIHTSERWSCNRSLVPFNYVSNSNFK